MSKKISINALNIEDQNRLTDEQKESIVNEGKIIVSASAGAGKTTTMVLKILALISEGKKLKDMLIVVYNDAAALELKEKLYEKLVERIDDSAISNSTRDMFVTELRDIDFCQISTIHAFCRKIVAENFQILGISPKFDILDDLKEAKLKDTALNNVFNSFKEDDEDFNDILEIFSKQRKDDNLKENIDSLYRIYNIQPNKEEFKQRILDCYSVDFENSYYVKYAYNFFMERFAVLLDKAKEAQNGLIGSLQDNFFNRCNYEIELLEKLLRAKDLIELLEAAFKHPKYDGKQMSSKTSDPNLKTVKPYMNICKAVVNNDKSLMEDMIEFYSSLDILKKAHKQNAKYVNKIMSIVEGLDVEFGRLKDEENAYTFDDLLHFTIKLIKEKEGGLDKYEYVFVDEYQDVTPLTGYITSYFIKDNSYLVGDVKQSIYGFNLADPTIFLKRQEEYANNGDFVINFNKNFRSRKNILIAVNDVFNYIMTTKTADIDYEHDAKFDTSTSVSGGEVEINIITNAPSKAKVENDKIYDITKDTSDEDEDITKSYYEGKFISDKIKHLINDDVYIHDKNNNPIKVKYSDIVILFRARNPESKKVIEAIREEGIPIDDSSFVSNSNNPEKDLIAFLRVIDNPRQDEYLAGYMLSFFGGYKEEELAKIANNFKGQYFYDKLVDAAKVDNELGNKIKETLNKINEYRVKSSFQSVSSLMNGIVSDYSYDAYLMHNGQGDVNALKTFIVKNVKKKADTLSEFINEYSNDEKIVAPVVGSEAVKVSTFHAYKGLESPIVFVANVTKGFNTLDSRKDLLYMGDGCIALKYFDLNKKNKYQSISYFALKQMLAAKLQKEEMRLLYVALTRAKEKMYITGVASETDAVPDYFFAKSNYEFLRQAEYINGGRTKIHYVNFEYKKVETPISIETFDESTIEGEIQKSLEFTYPHLTSTKLGMKYGVSSLISENEETQFAYDEKIDIGTLYHKVMQYIDYSVNTIEGIEKEYDRFVLEGKLTSEELEKVDKSLILECLNQPFIKEALDAEKQLKVHREENFMMYVEANKVSDKEEFNTNDKVLVQGIIDLFIENDDPTIIDFKYSKLSDPVAVKKYEKQLKLYKIAMEGKYGKKINNLLLYSFKTGKVHKI